MSNTTFTTTCSKRHAVFTLFIVLFCLLAGQANAAGELTGKFSVSSSTTVQFSQGNLQYHCTQKTFRFASSQYSVIGTANSNLSASYNGYIDLFGWGTSGYDGQTPTMTTNSSELYGPSGNISGTNYDWGVYNSISNGGTGWRTLSNSEWNYLLNSRASATSKRGLAKVNGVSGLVLLPDAFTLPSGLSFNSGNSAFTNNTYTASQWTQMEQAGAVFLPAGGFRYSSNGVSMTTYVGTMGYYWSATANGTYYANSLQFGAGYCYMDGDQVQRFNGFAVRLVKNSTGGGSTSSRKTIIAKVSPAGAGRAYGSGTYDVGETVTLRVVPNEGYSFFKWSDGSSSAYGNPTEIVVKDDATYTAYLNRISGMYQVKTAVGRGSGTVTGAGIYKKDTTVYLYATPAAGYVFDKWADGETSRLRGYTVVRDTTFTANFRSPGKVTLHISCDSAIAELAIGIGKGGTLTKWVARGHDISYNCNEWDTLYYKVFMRDNDYYFGHWNDAEGGLIRLSGEQASGGSTGEEQVRYQVMFQNFTDTAVFRKKERYYTITTTDDPRGKVTFTGGGTYREYDTAYIYVNRECIVRGLHLNRKSGSSTSYSSWSVQDGESLVQKLCVTENRWYEVKSYSVYGKRFDVTVNDPSMGTVQGAGYYCDGQALVAIPKPGYVFRGWTCPYVDNPTQLIKRNPLNKTTLVLKGKYDNPKGDTITPIPFIAHFEKLEVLASGYCGVPDENARYVFTNDGVLNITGTGPLKNFCNMDSVNRYSSVAANLKAYLYRTIPWLNEDIAVTEVNISEGITSVSPYFFISAALMAQ